jgi:hypothetical protein
VGKGTLLLVALVAMHDPCGTDTVAEGLNGACTRSSDCEKDLSCVGGVCSPADAARSDSGGDAGPDAGAADGYAAD